ncbi:hypothetical protein QYE76_037492 [Lolium multiflorum]|uniref:Uncharacterized protein n=1 Tax=Lolium multiflorum TaxID=4521 RepID=A0AAD8PID6_LOLMU|nr:hypothetical protein QYE76_037492 [Lolium multiflorum]
MRLPSQLLGNNPHPHASALAPSLRDSTRASRDLGLIKGKAAAARRLYLRPPACRLAVSRPPRIPRKTLFEELLWEHRELVEAHDKCQVIPEASIDALKEQLANAQPLRDPLAQQCGTPLSSSDRLEARVGDHEWRFSLPVLEQAYALRVASFTSIGARLDATLFQDLVSVTSGLRSLPLM